MASSIHDVRGILQRWDKGGSSVRQTMLRDFISQCSDMTAPELERQFCDCASLFLARLTVWLRMNHLRGPLKLLLKAISIFLSAASGHRFLAEFLEVGGALTVLEVVGTAGREEGKCEALQLLLTVAGRGRQFKELLCESFAVKVVAECLAQSPSEETQRLAQNLLHQLFIGNPHYQSQVYKALIGLLPCSSPSAQRMAAHTLTLVQPMVVPASEAIVEPSLQLLSSSHTDVQHEACCLLKELVRCEHVRQPILKGLVCLLRPPDRPHTPRQTADLNPAHLQQAGAARAICQLSSQNRDLASALHQLGVVPHLLHAMANTTHCDSQKQASIALHALLKAVPTTADDVSLIIGPNFLHKFTANPLSCYSLLSPSEIDILLAAVSMTTNYN